MSASDTEYSARFIGPELIERGRVNALTCPVYRDGALVAPTLSGSTITIWKADGSKIVDAVAVTSVTASIATYNTGTYSTETREDGWQVEWSLIFSGVARTFRRSAALVRARLHPVISDRDLYARHAELEGVRATGTTTDQSVIDESWAELLDMFRQRGSLSHLVMSPEDTRFLHLFLALQNRFTDLMTSAGDGSKWATLATMYTEKFREKFSTTSFRYDSDDDGIPDPERRRAPAVTFLGGHGSDPHGYVRALDWRR